VSHDWWAYILVTGCGGKVYYDEFPSVRYRQHKANIQGSNKSIKANFIRINKLVFGKYKEWNQRNINALRKIEFLISRENLQTLTEFNGYRDASIRKRVSAIWKKKIYRQTIAGNLAIILAIIFMKI
jgi:hypothetical protein